MSETDERIVAELRRQSRFLELMEKRQRDIHGELKIVGRLILVAVSVLALASL